GRLLGPSPAEHDRFDRRPHEAAPRRGGHLPAPASRGPGGEPRPARQRLRYDPQDSRRGPQTGGDMSQDRNIRRDRRTVRVFTEPRCLDHRAPRGYPESPDRLTGVMSHLAARGWPITDVGVAREVAEPAVAAVHDPAYVERFRRAAERGDALLDSADNPLSAGTWEAAWAAVSATLAAAEHATENGGGYAFAAVRPPGHHAEKALAMG